MPNVEVYDLDGVVFTDQIPFPTQAVSKLFNADDPHDFIAPPIHEIDRPIDTSLILSPKELANLGRTRMKTVNPDTWEYIWDRRGVVIANTGRPNKPAWIELTRQALEAANLATRFNAVYFRPTGVSGVESKGAALLQLLGSFDTVDFYDDDPWVIFGLARQFPQINFKLVQPLDVGDLMLSREREFFPNVERIARLQVIQPPPVYVHHEPDPNAEPSYFALRQMERERAAAED